MCSPVDITALLKVTSHTSWILITVLTVKVVITYFLRCPFSVQMEICKLSFALLCLCALPGHELPALPCPKWPILCRVHIKPYSLTLHYFVTVHSCGVYFWWCLLLVGSGQVLLRLLSKTKVIDSSLDFGLIYELCLTLVLTLDVTLDLDQSQVLDLALVLDLSLRLKF